MNKALFGRVGLQRKQYKWFMHIYKVHSGSINNKCLRELLDPSLLGIIQGYFLACTTAYIPLPTLGLDPQCTSRKRLYSKHINYILSFLSKSTPPNSACIILREMLATLSLTHSFEHTPN